MTTPDTGPLFLVDGDDEPLRGSVVVDNDGHAWQRRSPRFWEMASQRDEPATWDELVGTWGPLLLVWEPAEDSPWASL